ncbi:MAG: MFS transporter [Phycisphaerae bacterium]|jgi:MFS family permease
MSLRSRSYDVLPALSVRRRELRHSLRRVTVAWMFGVVWMSCTSGDQVRAFCRMLGFNDFAFGLMGALPFLASLGQLLAAEFIERTGLRKHLFIPLALVHRLLWLVVAAVPLVLGPGYLAVTVVLAILAASNFLGQASSPAWVTWMGDLIPRRIRGRYFARRTQASQAVQVVAVIVLSVFLDHATSSGRVESLAGQGRLMWTICIIFAIGAIFGAIDILVFWRIREVLPPHGPQASAAPRAGESWWQALRGSLADLLIHPLKDRIFRNFVSYGAVVTFTMTVSGWYFWRYSTEGLGFSKLGTNCLFMVIGPLAGTVTAKWWGRLQDRWGRRPVLILSTLGAAISLLPWFFMSRAVTTPAFLVDTINWISAHLGMLWGARDLHIVGPTSPVVAYLLASLGCVIGGSAWTGVGLAQTGMILGFSDSRGGSKFVAACSVLMGIGGVVGGLVGGAVAQSLEFMQSHPIVLGPLKWNNWHVTFAMSLLARLLSLAWLNRMPDPGARTVRSMLRYWSASTYNNYFSFLSHPLRIFGWGQGKVEDDRRRPRQ